MKPLYISLAKQVGSHGAYQIAIESDGHGYSLLGPKYSGDECEFASRQLTAKDSQKIRHYLDAAFPNPDKEALQKIHDILQRPASNQRFMQIASRECLNIIKPLLLKS